VIVQSAEESTIAQNLDLLFAKTPLAVHPEALINASSAAELFTVIHYLAPLLAYINLAALTRLFNVILSVLSLVPQGAVLVVGLLAAQLYARFAPIAGEASVPLVSQFTATLLFTLRRANRENRLGIVAGISVIPPYEGEELLLLYQATVDGLQTAREESVTRQRALGVLVDIFDKVPVEKIEPLGLFLALRKSFDEVPFKTAYLKPLAVVVGIGVDIEHFITGSKLSIEGLFGLIGKDESVVIDVLRKVAKANDITSGLLGVFNARELAQFGGIALKVAQQPLSVQVLDLLSAIVIAGIGSDDRTVTAFRKTIVTVLLPIAEKKEHPGRDIALGTVRALVH
jgi:hypothetical protein